MTTLENQRKMIQLQVNEHFNTEVEIAPRAMAALQGAGSVYWEEDGDVIEVISVFQALLASSPACLIALHNGGVNTQILSEQFHLPEQQIPCKLAPNTLDLIFYGYDESYRFLSHKAIGNWTETASDIEANISTYSKLTEVDLFRAMLQTAYQGPRVVNEHTELYELQTCLSDIGKLLISAGFADLLDIHEYLNENERYRAELRASEKFKKLSQDIRNLGIHDPSHHAIQFAFYLDSKQRIRVQPFGLTSVGISQPEYLKDGVAYKYRNNIFQPINTIQSSIHKDSIEQLEDMINSKRCSESDFQKFFEMHQDFLLGFDYHRTHPQLILSSDENMNLIPDFFLEPLESHFCDILELKLPYSELTRRLQRGNRVHFRAFVNEAVAQLTEYQRYFDDRSNRRDFHKKYGLEAYKPKLILVIGRSCHFRSDLERREISRLLPDDLDMWTYDDLLLKAKRFASFANDTFNPAGCLGVGPW